MATHFDDLIGETLADRFAANRPGNADEGGSDDAPARRDRDDAGGDGDGRSPGDGERGDESTTERRARRRLERDLKAARRQIEELQDVNGALGGRLANVEKFLVSGHVQQSARSAAERVAAAQLALEKAKDDVDVKAETQALRELQEALLEEADLKRTARAQAAEPAAPARTESPQRANPDRDNWLKRHKDWFDPSMKDLDSEIAGTISQRLLDDGYGHDDPEHYERLDAELKKRMPHLFKGKGGRSQDPDDDPEDDRDALPRSSGGDRTYGNGGRSGRGGDDDIPPPSREYVALWAQQNRDFDPKNKEHVAEMRRYWADRQRKRMGSR